MCMQVITTVYVNLELHISSLYESFDNVHVRTQEITVAYVRATYLITQEFHMKYTHVHAWSKCCLHKSYVPMVIKHY